MLAIMCKEKNITEREAILACAMLDGTEDKPIALDA